MTHLPGLQARTLGSPMSLEAFSCWAAETPNAPQELKELWKEYLGSIVFDCTVKFSPKEKSGVETEDGTLAVDLIFGPGDGPNSFGCALQIVKQYDENYTPIASLGGNCYLVHGFEDNKIYTFLPNVPEGDQVFFEAFDNISAWFDHLMVEQESEVRIAPKPIASVDRGLAAMVEAREKLN